MPLYAKGSRRVPLKTSRQTENIPARRHLIYSLSQRTSRYQLIIKMADAAKAAITEGALKYAC
jgi:hypothetical protein